MITPSLFKDAMRHFASGVTVITWLKGDDALEGITVSAFSSLSLTPPLILFCIDRHARTYPTLSTKTQVCVNILSAQQIDVAYQFAGQGKKESAVQFDKNPQGVPMLCDSLVNISVQIQEKIQQGDHDIFIAEVIDARIKANTAPLLYYKSEIFPFCKSD